MALALVTITLARGDRSSAEMQLVGNLTIMLALVFSAVVCGWASWRERSTRLGWSLMALSWALGAAGQVVYSANAAAGDGNVPSPVLDTIAYLGYSVPVIAALFAFPKPKALLISRFRGVLDAVAITLGLVFISEATVLQPVRTARDLEGLASWSGLAYPIADLAICAVVFTLAMRQPPSNRLVWTCLGSGLLVLAIADSAYVRLLADGQKDLTGTPLVLGWAAAPVLTALAALLPQRVPSSRSWDLTLMAQLIPYAPVVGAVVVLPLSPFRQDGFLQVVGVLLVAAVTLRQVMIVYENISLTRDLEAKVAARTAELTTLGSILTSSSDAIVGVSVDGDVIALNRAAEQLYGYRSADVLGRQSIFLPEQSAQRLRSLLDRAQRGLELEGYETDWTRPDGRVVPVAARLSPIRSGDSVEGISIFGQDITERRRAAAALERAREEALEASRLKSEFLATMSHEIRTPMNGVIGLASLLLETELNEVQHQYASGVLGAGEALLGVISDILDFSKLEAGKVILDPVDFDPRRLVEDIGALLAPAAASKRIELFAYCLPEVPKAVRGDSGRIRQILLNLASNAVKFTHDGEVSVKVKPIDLTDTSTRLRFEVTDTGIGIAEEDRSRLFQSFSQADASTTRRFGGTGLGLAISRSLVEVMNGEIGMESQQGVGSTFWFEVTLPVTERSASKPEGSLLCGRRVLVVDDNATNRNIVTAQLSSWQMPTDSAPDAATGLDRLRTAAHGGRPYDLVLLDMLMPDMDGLELARRISADPELHRTAVVMLASTLQLDPKVLQEAGVGQWLTKPVRSSELYDKLMRVFAPHEAPAKRGEVDRLQHGSTPSRGRVLVVEDNPVNQMVARGLLEHLGFTLDMTANGSEALAALDATNYDAVLMDCHMPVMDGFTATQRIREREVNGSRLPIIAMTAGALIEDRDRCLASGMDDYVTKPVTAEVLDAVLTARLGPALPGPTLHNPAAGAEVTRAQGRPAIDETQLSQLRELGTVNGSSLLTAIINSFVEHSGEHLAALQRAHADRDAPRLHAVAHELKGSASTVGAVGVTALCRDIELAAHATGGTLPPGSIKELELELDEARRALRRIACSAP